MEAVPAEPISAMAGPYRIVRRLGSGGMGVVYVGVDTSGMQVAVKLIRPEYAADPEHRARLRQEVAAAQRVPRFCTAPVLAADLAADPPWVATEYIDGPTLDVLLLERGPLSGSSLEAFAVGVAMALRAVHGHGVIHRDLKPSNVLLSSVGPRVIDFGIARVEEHTRLTRTGAVVGTPAYMSPEQLAGQPLTAAVDVFAWGCLVVYAATGRPPFGSGLQAAYRILHEAPDLDGLPESLRELVDAALHKQPAERPSAVELVELLSHSAAEAATQVLATASAAPAAESTAETGPPTPTGPAQPPTPAGPDAPRPRRALAAVKVGASIAVVAAVAVAASSTSIPPFTQVTGGLFTGHTGWLLAAAALVLLAVPGVALFYGGGPPSRPGPALAAVCFNGVGLAFLLWLLYGFSVAFGWGSVVGLFSGDALNFYFGSAHGLRYVAFRAFTATIAAVTVAIVASGVAGRVGMRFWVSFVFLWSTVGMFPVAHWVWADGGWLTQLGVYDAAGSLGVHVTAGAAVLALGLVLRGHAGTPPDPSGPRYRPAAVLTGATLVWFGWIGTMIGWRWATGWEARHSTGMVWPDTTWASSSPVGAVAGAMMLHAATASAAAVLGWLLVAWFRSHRVTGPGVMSGAVVGVLAATPVLAVGGDPTDPVPLLITGIAGGAAGTVCALTAMLRRRARLGNSFDVVNIHLVGGAVGAVVIGGLSAAHDEVTAQFLLHMLAVMAVAGYSFGVAWLAGRVLGRAFRHELEPRPAG